MSLARLGVNIDHVATIRQARDEIYPSIEEACKVVIDAGADQVTIHLREDRRHIQDYDVTSVRAITEQSHCLFNFEMGACDEIVDLAINIRPDWVCLVPEKREEKTTEGGLNLLDSKTYDRIKKTCHKIKSANESTQISLFLEANEQVLTLAGSLGVNAVEIHTGEFARRVHSNMDFISELSKFKKAQEILSELKLGCHAGHGLTQKSTMLLLQEKNFVEYNIGHSIIAEAVFKGLNQVVKEYKTLFTQYPL